jgi:UDP-N-acetylglucosamine 2-epimerase
MALEKNAKHLKEIFMKIMQIVGARPQFVKLAPLSRLAREKHHEVIVHSGQHYDHQMNEVFFSDLGIAEPDHHLGAGNTQDLGQIAHIITSLEPVLKAESPDIVIVYGDTNTTLAAALVSARMGYPVAHVEAGLRSFNSSMPEETNRILTDHLADILFVPTQTALANAANEGLAGKCHVVGDIMVDSLQLGIALAEELPAEPLDRDQSPYWLLTLHRPYNVDDQSNLRGILDGLDSLGHRIVFPVHPRTAKMIAADAPSSWKHIELIGPQSYLRFLRLMNGARMVITDSGGIQKEAYVLKRPCITLRTETEWTETIASGWNLLLPPGSDAFPTAIKGFFPPDEHPNLYGSEVSHAILSVLEDWYTKHRK